MHRFGMMFVMETHISGEKAEKISKSLGFDWVERIDAKGFAEGIWALISSNIGNHVVLNRDDQCLTMLIKEGGDREWVCSVVYASPCTAQKEDLSRHVKRKMVIRDLSNYAAPSEKRGGFFSARRGACFRERLDQCGLMDLGFKGSPCTYRRAELCVTTTRVRLDRAACNPEWRLMFPEACVQHLPRTSSNHNPILLKVHGTPPPKKDRPSHFQAAWMLHDSVEDVAREAWAGGTDTVVEAIDKCTEGAKLFNQNTFGNIFRNKRYILSRYSELPGQICFFSVRP